MHIWKIQRNILLCFGLLAILAMLWSDHMGRAASNEKIEAAILECSSLKDAWSAKNVPISNTDVAAGLKNCQILSQQKAPVLCTPGATIAVYKYNTVVPKDDCLRVTG